MPLYTPQELKILGEHGKVEVPEFKWNKVEKAAHPVWEETSSAGRRRSSHHHQKRPLVMPKASIPLAQRADLFGEDKEGSDKKANGDDDEDANSDIDDDIAAAYYLKQKQRQQPAMVTPTSVDSESGVSAPVVNLKYAAALAASMHMEQEQGAADKQSAIADEEEDEADGWISVSREPKHRKKSFDRRKGSFSRWRRATNE